MVSNTRKTKRNTGILSALILFFAVLCPVTDARILFQDDSFADVISDGIILDADNDAPGNIVIQFGETLAETLEWNSTDTRFDLSDDLNISGGLEVSDDIDLNLNELVEVRTENLSSAPTCNAGSAGRQYYDTDEDLLYFCDSVVWRRFDQSVMGQFYDSSGGTDLDTTTDVAIPFDAETREDAGITHDTVTNNSRITLDNPGWYQVTYSVTHSNATLTVANTACRIRLNGTTNVDPSRSYVVDTTAFSSRATNSGSALIETTTANEYFEIMCQNHGISILGSLPTVADESWVVVERK